MYQVELGKPEEYKDVHKILWRAFEIEKKLDHDKMEPGDWWHKEGFARSYVIKDNGRIVANMTLETLPATIRGSEISVVGIGAVATEPTHRRVGMIRSLFETAFQSMKEKGEVYSMLDPFKIDYYEKFGYANAETRAQYRFKPSNIIPLSIPNNIKIREAVEADEKSLMDLQRSSMVAGSRLYLTKDNIGKRIKTQNSYIIEEEGRPAGWFTLYFNRDTTELDWEKQKLTMTVSLAFYFNNFTVLNSLLHFLSKFEDQVNLIRLNSGAEVPISYYIKNRYKLIIEPQGSMMIRVIDFKKYIELIQIPKSVKDEVVLKLEDAHCPWNSGTYQLTPNDGRLTLSETDEVPEIAVSDQQLSRIVGGLNSIVILQYLGLIECTIEVAKKLEAIFPEDTLMSYMRF